jgi:hypothetical protein
LTCYIPQRREMIIKWQKKAERRNINSIIIL